MTQKAYNVELIVHEVIDNEFIESVQCFDCAAAKGERPTISTLINTNTLLAIIHIP